MPHESGRSPFWMTGKVIFAGFGGPGGVAKLSSTAQRESKTKESSMGSIHT